MEERGRNRAADADLLQAVRLRLRLAVVPRNEASAEMSDGLQYRDGIPTYPIRELHQIEITSRCNLRCPYCVHPSMPRAKEDMSEDVYRRALYWAARFVSKGQQGELNLAGIGESTIHPEFVRYVHLAREAVGPDCVLVIATNGINMTDEMAEAIAPAGIHVFVSLHRPEKAGPAIEMLARAKIPLVGFSTDPATAAMDWAGQVEWHVSAPQPRTCAWVKGGGVFAMSDGRVTRCCLDGKGEEPLGHVNDDLEQMRTSPYTLCKGCDQNLEIPAWHQPSGRQLPLVTA